NTEQKPLAKTERSGGEVRSRPIVKHKAGAQIIFLPLDLSPRRSKQTTRHNKIAMPMPAATVTPANAMLTNASAARQSQPSTFRQNSFKSTAEARGRRRSSFFALFRRMLFFRSTRGGAGSIKRI